jgi:hypothetical protein
MVKVRLQFWGQKGIDVTTKTGEAWVALEMDSVPRAGDSVEYGAVSGGVSHVSWVIDSDTNALEAIVDVR